MVSFPYMAFSVSFVLLTLRSLLGGRLVVGWMVG
jgi:hypothetical protein